MDCENAVWFHLPGSEQKLESSGIQFWPIISTSREDPKGYDRGSFVVVAI